MERYGQILAALLAQGHPARLNVSAATKLLLGKGKVTGYRLLAGGKFPVPVFGTPREQYVRLQDVAALLADLPFGGEEQGEVGQQKRRRVGRPPKLEQIAEERRRAVAATHSDGRS